MDINSLVKDSIPSKKTQSSSEIQFESIGIKMRQIVLEQDPNIVNDVPSDVKNVSPGSKWKDKKILAGGAGALALGGGGIYAVMKRNQLAEKGAAKAIGGAQMINPNLKQIKMPGDSPTTSQVADISKSTLAGKSGDAAQSMGQAAGQWGQTLKSGMGGAADFASRNPHLALAATALGGVAALKKLRRR